MSLNTIVQNALGGKGVEVVYPGYLKSALATMEDTRCKIDRIVPINKERILFDLAQLARQDLDTALQTTANLIEELVGDYNKKYKFGFELDSIEDNDYIVRLKKLLNSLLIFKAHRLFNKGLTHEAQSIKRDQITYLNTTRYDGWREDAGKWLQVEKSWAQKEEEASKTLFPDSEETDIFYPAEGSHSDYGVAKRALEEHGNDKIIFESYLNLGEHQSALIFALEKIQFYLTPNLAGLGASSMKDVYNPLIIVNAPFVKEWSENILRIQQLTTQFDGKRRQELIDAIEHVLNLDAVYGQVRGDAKTFLSNIMFQLDDTL